MRATSIQVDVFNVPQVQAKLAEQSEKIAMAIDRIRELEAKLDDVRALYAEEERLADKLGKRLEAVRAELVLARERGDALATVLQSWTDDEEDALEALSAWRELWK